MWRTEWIPWKTLKSSISKPTQSTATSFTAMQQPFRGLYVCLQIICFAAPGGVEATVAVKHVRAARKGYGLPLLFV